MFSCGSFYFQEISIHPPREGWDAPSCCVFKSRSGFQSTHPVRGGTPGAPVAWPASCRFQSTHPVRGGTAGKVHMLTPTEVISIHPPREGWDFNKSRCRQVFKLFQSTHPVRGGTG